MTPLSLFLDQLTITKLQFLTEKGWKLDGVAIKREEAGQTQHGAVISGGKVLWWNQEQPQPLTDEQLLKAFNSCEKVIDGLHAVAELASHGITKGGAQ